MKKKIQKYLAGEREGFSLVELIIVIAIMAILIGVVTLAVLPNIAKSKESKDITALDSLLSAVNNAVASQQVSADGSIQTAVIANNEADIAGATSYTGTGSDKIRNEIVKLMSKDKIPFSSSKVCKGGNSLKCTWKFESNGKISIEVAIVKGTGTNAKIVRGDYLDKFASSNGPLITAVESEAAAPSAT